MVDIDINRVTFDEFIKLVKIDDELCDIKNFNYNFNLLFKTELKQNDKLKKRDTN